MSRLTRFDWRPPLYLQVLALVFASLIFAQILAMAILLMAPPPRPEPVFIRQIAAALAGAPSDAFSPRKLVRSVAPASQALVAQAPASPTSQQRRELLAALLHAPLQTVMLNETRPSPLVRLLTMGVGIPGSPAPLHGGSRPPPPPGPPPTFGQAHPLGLPPPFGPSGQPPEWRHPPEDDLLFDDFTAALKRPDGTVVVVRPEPDPFPTAWQLSMMAWLVGALLVVAPAAFWFGRRISAPLDRFAMAAQRLGRDPMAPPLVVSGPAEIHRAAMAFNDMQLRVRRYVEDRTGMIGAISHDLRTPLARIRFKLEADSPNKASINADIDQMEVMIDQVLTFIRDASEPGRRERINILSLVETVVDESVEIGAAVRLAPSDDGQVEGDVQALKRVIGNLIDNAIKYGGGGDVRVIGTADDMVVEVEDDGPGLAPDEREQVFKPFFRTEAARTLDAGGVGLGLALSRSIARAHGGDITLEVRQRGLVAVVRLPRAEAYQPR